MQLRSLEVMSVEGAARQHHSSMTIQQSFRPVMYFTNASGYANAVQSCKCEGRLDRHAKSHGDVGIM